MTPFEKLGRELSDVLERYKPVKVVDAYTLKRRAQIRDSMRRIRAARLAAGLNNRGLVPKPNLGRPCKN